MFILAFPALGLVGDQMCFEAMTSTISSSGKSKLFWKRLVWRAQVIRPQGQVNTAGESGTEAL